MDTPTTTGMGEKTLASPLTFPDRSLSQIGHYLETMANISNPNQVSSEIFEKFIERFSEYELDVSPLLYNPQTFVPEARILISEKGQINRGHISTQVRWPVIDFAEWMSKDDITGIPYWETVCNDCEEKINYILRKYEKAKYLV